MKSEGRMKDQVRVRSMARSSEGQGNGRVKGGWMVRSGEREIKRKVQVKERSSGKVR